MAERDFADDIVEELLDRVSKGEQLVKLCADVKMPARSTVYSWIDCDPEFAGQFRAARARGVHALAEQCLEIADEPVSKDDSVAVANKRVRIDTRLRLAGKWLAAEYGDKLDVNYNAEITHRHDLSSYSADELDALEKLVAKSSDASRDTGGEGAEKPGSVH
jgi:hypothetical protein